ncbi:hypothetical protein BC943DRAFT_330093 [Umbelopsis sp. AD052]|nr:hypothetical protein BC943DRAFT_330093 [Umbelopsis sp. AD052]
MFQKLVNFWVQSFVTERLLASKTFNAVAAKTHQHVSTITSKGKYYTLAGRLRKTKT